MQTNKNTLILYIYFFSVEDILNFRKTHHLNAPF